MARLNSTGLGRRILPSIALMMLLLLSPLAGCLGGDDEKKPSKVHVVWGADATAGTILHIMAPNSQNTTQSLDEAEFTFDFNETYSEEGDISTFWVDPGNGDPVVEVNAADMSTVTVSYDKHGIYRATLGANDSEGNSGEVEVFLRVEYELHYDNTQSTDNPYPVWFDTSPGSDEASPRRVDLMSNATNPPGWLLQPGGPSTVTWTVRNPADTEEDASTKEIADGGEDQYGWGTNDPLAGGWRMDIDVEGDQITTETFLTIEYEPLETDIPEPPASGSFV
ncbi:MAG TPA: hypothetical protein EYN30_01865, partial [Candidatus Poseidoniales archaeon]|nr:hypothetical protein [Candidatus Poseidoniales archaeon]